MLLREEWEGTRRRSQGVSRQSGPLFSEGSARSTCLCPLGVVVVEPESSRCPSRHCSGSPKPPSGGSGRCGFGEVRPWPRVERQQVVWGFRLHPRPGSWSRDLSEHALGSG